MATWKKIITSGSNAELNHISASGNIIPITTDGSSLGSVSHNFSDLFLDSGAVINLDSGDVTLTHSSNKLTLGGGSLDVDGGIAIDNITIDGTEIDLSSGDLTIDAHAGDIILDAAGKDISLTDGAGTAEFIFNLEDAPELDIDGDFTIDGSGGITLDSATNVVDLIGNVTASGNISGSSTSTLTLGGDVNIVKDKLKIGGTAVTTTAAELNFLDTAAANSVVNSKAVIYGSSGELAGTLSTAAQTNITDVGALDEGSITSGFGTINNGASAITTTGTVSAGRVNTTGGVHVGGTADPGTDNLIVDGITILTGNVTASGVISASGGFVGDGSGLTGVGTDIDGLDALGGTGLHQTDDHFLFSDAGTEKKITFSNLEDAIFGNVSGDATIAAEGALTIADDTIGNAELKQDDDITLQSLTLTGNLTVNGTTTTIATTNTEMKDQFILLASGSSVTNVDAGIIVQSGSVAGTGSAFYHDISDERWAVGKSLDAGRQIATAPTSFVTTVKTDTVNPNTTSGSYGAGEMHVNTSTGDIWIRFG